MTASLFPLPALGSRCPVCQGWSWWRVDGGRWQCWGCKPGPADWQAYPRWISSAATATSRLGSALDLPPLTDRTSAHVKRVAPGTLLPPLSRHYRHGSSCHIVRHGEDGNVRAIHAENHSLPFWHSKAEAVCKR